MPTKLAAKAINTLSVMPRYNSSQRVKSGGTMRANMLPARSRPWRTRAVSTSNEKPRDQTR